MCTLLSIKMPLNILEKNRPRNVILKTLEPTLKSLPTSIKKFHFNLWLFKTNYIFKDMIWSHDKLMPKYFLNVEEKIYIYLFFTSLLMSGITFVAIILIHWRCSFVMLVRCLSAHTNRFYQKYTEYVVHDFVIPGN